jgi:hypothetical protein
MGILSPRYAAAFDGVGFFELGTWYQGMTVETDGTLYSRVGSGHTYVDMGRAPLIFEISAGVEETQKAALIAKRGDSGTLVWSRGSQTATLLDILPTEADAVDGHTLTLRFFSDDLPAGVAPSSAVISENGAYMLTEAGEFIIQE